MAIGDTTVRLHGVVDWRRHVGSAVQRIEGSDDPDANALLQWNLGQFTLHPGGAVAGPPPPPPEDGTWSAPAPLTPETSELHAVLLLLLNLASDRPENPQLLLQSNARYLGEERIDGEELSVFTGPGNLNPEATADAAESNLRYWVDESGNLRRVEARISDVTGYVIIDLATDGDPVVEMIPGMAP